MMFFTLIDPLRISTGPGVSATPFVTHAEACRDVDRNRDSVLVPERAVKAPDAQSSTVPGVSNRALFQAAAVLRGNDRAAGTAPIGSFFRAMWYTVAMATPSAEMILGLEPGGEGLVRAVRSGLPVSAFASVAGYTQLTRETLARAAGIPLRTVQRRTTSSRLKRDESDRLARVARIYALAETVLGSRQAAEQWMLSPNWALDGARPVDQIDTDVAGREVEDALGRIDDGTFA